MIFGLENPKKQFALSLEQFLLLSEKGLMRVQVTQFVSVHLGAHLDELVATNHPLLGVPRALLRDLRWVHRVLHGSSCNSTHNHGWDYEDIYEMSHDLGRLQTHPVKWWNGDWNPPNQIPEKKQSSQPLAKGEHLSFQEGVQIFLLIK